MAEAINHNNILDIIKSQITQSIKAINEIAVNAAAAIKTGNVKGNLQVVNEVVDLVFSKQGFFGKIYEYVKEVSVSQLLKIPLVLKAMDYTISKLVQMMKKQGSLTDIDFTIFRELAKTLQEVASIENIAASYNTLMVLVDYYINLLDKISSYNLNEYIFEKLDDLNLATIGVLDILKAFNDVTYNNIKSMVVAVVSLKLLLNQYLSLLTTIWGINIPDNSLKNMDAVLNSMPKLTKLFSDVNEMSKVISTKNLLALQFILKHNLLYNVIDNLYTILLRLSNLPVLETKEIEERLSTMSKSVSMIKMMIINLLILVPLIGLLVIAAPVLIAGILMLRLLIWVVLKIMTFEVDATMVRKVTVLSTVIAVLVLIGAELLLLAATAAILILAWKPIMVFFLVLIAVLLFIDIIGKFLVSGKLVLSLLMLNIVLGLLTLTASLLILIGLASLAVLPLSGHILLMILLIIAVAAVIALMGVGLSYAMPFIAAAVLALVPLTVAILAIFTMAGLLFLLGKIKFTEDDKKNITDNVATIMSTSIQVMTAIFDAGYNLTKTDSGLEGDSWVAKILKGIVGSSALVLMALASAAILTPMIISVFSILLIAGLLWVLGKISFTPDDKKNITDNVTVVIDTAFLVIHSIFDPDSNDTKNKPDNRNWFVNAIATLGSGIMNIISSVLAIGFLALTIVSVALVLVLAGELKLLEKIQLDSELVKQNIKKIITSSFTVIDAIFGVKEEPKETPSKKSWLKSAIDWVGDKATSIFNGIKNITGMLMSIGYLAVTMIAIGMVYILAQQLTYIAKLKFSQADVINKTNLIMGSANSVINLVTNSNLSEEYTDKIETVHKNTTNIIKVLSSLKKMSNTMSDMNNISKENVDNNTKVVGNYIKLLDKVNTVKLENVKTLTNMFAKMAEFSNSIHGDIDGLVEALANRIAPLLEELRDIMNGLPQEVQTGTENISKTIINTSGSAANWTQDNIKQASSVVSNKDEQANIQREQFNKAQKEKENQDRISSILDEIKDILTGRGSYPSGVKTY